MTDSTMPDEQRKALHKQAIEHKYDTSKYIELETVAGKLRSEISTKDKRIAELEVELFQSKCAIKDMGTTVESLGNENEALKAQLKTMAGALHFMQERLEQIRAHHIKVMAENESNTLQYEYADGVVDGCDAGLHEVCEALKSYAGETDA